MKDKPNTAIQIRASVKYYSIILKIFFTFTIIDFSGDFLIRQRGAINFFLKIEEFIRGGIISSLIIIGVLGLLNVFYLGRVKSIGLLCLSLIIFIFCYGLLYGLFVNDFAHAFRESLPFVAIFIVPLLINMDKIHQRNLALYFIYLLTIFSALKIVVVQIVSLSIYGELSWKVLLRLSPFLILPYFYFLLNILKKEAAKYDFIMLLIVIVSLLIANARALNLITLIGTIIIVFNSKISVRLLFVACIIIFSMWITILATNGDVQNVLGIWSGDHLDNTVNHRLLQLEILFNRFLDRPITGFGLGYFTPNYDNYGDLELPYLLELDLINFFTKIGLPLSLVYMLSYALLYFQYIKNKFQYGTIEFSYLLSIILLLIYSLFQTTHSGFPFWTLFAMAFSFLFRKS